MFDKKIILFTILTLLSITAGGILGLLDIYGFVDGRHELSLSLFLLSILTVYFITITVLLFDFIESGRIALSLIVSAFLFGITFFLMNLSISLTLFATFLYFTFLIYVYQASKKKASNQIKFDPGDIFLPIVRNGTLYLLILVSAIAFTQSQHLISRNDLVKPALLKIIMKPGVAMLNSQINSQTQQQIKQIPSDLKRQEGTPKIVRLMLQETVKAMAQNNSSGTIYGLKPEEIPINIVDIDNAGNVNIVPMFDAMLPTISTKLNTLIQQYAVFAPFVVALLTFFILQPLLIPINWIEGILTLIIFRTLIGIGVIKITEEQKAVQKVSL